MCVQCATINQKSQINFQLSKEEYSPNGFGSVDRMCICRLKGCGFNSSGQGPVLQLQAQTPTPGKVCVRYN